MSTDTAHVIPEWTMGDRLRKARSITGLSTRDFAESIGVSHGTITNAEGDKRAVRPITIKMWAMATGVPVEWLEHGIVPSQDGPNGGGWAPRGSNPEPTDSTFAQVIPLRKAA